MEMAILLIPDVWTIPGPAPAASADDGCQDVFDHADHAVSQGLFSAVLRASTVFLGW